MPVVAEQDARISRKGRAWRIPAAVTASFFAVVLAVFLVPLAFQDPVRIGPIWLFAYTVNDDVPLWRISTERSGPQRTITAKFGSRSLVWVASTERISILYD